MLATFRIFMWVSCGVVSCGVGVFACACASQASYL